MSAGDNVDEVTMTIPKIELGDITKEYDKYSKALRQLDVSIQKANWEADVDFDDKNLAI